MLLGHLKYPSARHLVAALRVPVTSSAEAMHDGLTSTLLLPNYGYPPALGATRQTDVSQQTTFSDPLTSTDPATSHPSQFFQMIGTVRREKPDRGRLTRIGTTPQKLRQSWTNGRLVRERCLGMGTSCKSVQDDDPASPKETCLVACQLSLRRRSG